MIDPQEMRTILFECGLPIPVEPNKAAGQTIKQVWTSEPYGHRLFLFEDKSLCLYLSDKMLTVEHNTAWPPTWQGFFSLLKSAGFDGTEEAERRYTIAYRAGVERRAEKDGRAQLKDLLKKYPDEADKRMADMAEVLKEALEHHQGGHSAIGGRIREALGLPQVLGEDA